MPPHIETIAKKHLRDPIRIKVETPKATSEQAARVTQVAYVVQREYKAKALGRILEIEQPNSAILFCRTRSDADELVETLAHRGFKPLALHGGLAQPQRDRVMNLFRSGGANLLVATDIAARGLDISHLSHVVNFDLPADPDSYVHRIGRVGRAGRAGVALTFVAPREQHALNFIERRTGLRITVAPVPSAGDLKAARLDRLRRQLRDSLAATPADDLKAMVAELAKESSAADVAAAALSLLRTPAKPDDELDIPSGVAPRVPRPERGPRFERGPDRGFDERHRAGRRPTNRGMAKVFFGIGRDSGVVPRDLVGAIANEAGIPGKDLGAIDLTDRFALVEVPHDLAGYVVEAMQGVRIRGRRVNVRPDRPPTGEI
jgi:ATP-dependent RNA helicase DeaD